MVALSDGTVLAAGGSNNGALSSSEVFTPSTQSWAPTASTMINARQQLNGVAPRPHGAGSWGYGYRPRFITLPPGLARAEYQKKMLADGTATAVGGAAGTDFTYASSEECSPTARAWKTVGPMITARDDFQMVLLRF